MIRDLAFTAYPCADVASTRAWYERHLGLQFSGPYVEDGSEKYNEANVGPGCFALMWHGWMETLPGSGNGVNFEVDEIEKLVADLRASGVTVGDVETLPTCSLASLRDPEGNRLSLHQTAAHRRR
jgi:catechol 2,3-dioxygenase-like lactoylglutathione lyase family enzyme